jgi:hypothetical protein
MATKKKRAAASTKRHTAKRRHHRRVSGTTVITTTRRRRHHRGGVGGILPKGSMLMQFGLTAVGAIGYMAVRDKIANMVQQHTPGMLGKLIAPAEMVIGMTQVSKNHSPLLKGVFMGMAVSGATRTASLISPTQFGRTVAGSSEEMYTLPSMGEIAQQIAGDYVEQSIAGNEVVLQHSGNMGNYEYNEPYVPLGA